MYFVPVIKLRTYDGREIVRLRDDIKREPGPIDGPYQEVIPAASFSIGRFTRFVENPRGILRYRF